ncbi:MAG: HDOD domain-containing protein [Gammaproteobacteria bacterium]|nr:HDOD domain-containing protein [Gammaproteobacteria bacterium]
MQNDPPDEPAADVPASVELTEESAPDDGQILEEIRQGLDDLHLGFDVKVLNVLDDERARPAEIEALKEKLGETVSVRLFSVANSNYYGKSRSGKITKFIDVVTHLGVDTTRSLAIFIALMALADTEDLRRVFARNFATSKLAELLALEFGLKPEERSTVGLAGLFLEIGKVIMALYERQSGRVLGPEFVAHHYPWVGGRLIEAFGLPPALGEIIDHSYFRFVKKDELSLAAVVDLAHAVVDISFSRHGKLIIESPMPDPEGILYARTAGSTIAGQFQSIGLSAYVHVVPSEYTEQERHLYEHRKKELDSH